MKEQKLLELAAKAAGINGVYSETHPEFGDDWIQTGIWMNDEDDCMSCWNPLYNMSVAASLAMKLCSEGKLKIQITEHGVDCYWNHDGVFVPNYISYHCYSPDAAFKLCVTQSAAQIGKVMK